MERQSQREQAARAVYLDSDAMLFHDVRELFAVMPAGPRLFCSHAHSPAVAFIQIRGVVPRLDPGQV